MQIARLSRPSTSSPSSTPTKDSKDRRSLGIMLHGNSKDRRAPEPRIEGLRDPSTGKISLHGKEINISNNRAKAVGKVRTSLHHL